jgi:hypothetical protein
VPPDPAGEVPVQKVPSASPPSHPTQINDGIRLSQVIAAVAAEAPSQIQSLEHALHDTQMYFRELQSLYRLYMARAKTQRSTPPLVWKVHQAEQGAAAAAAAAAAEVAAVPILEVADEASNSPAEAQQAASDSLPYKARNALMKPLLVEASRFANEQRLLPLGLAAEGILADLDLALADCQALHRRLKAMAVGH